MLDILDRLTSGIPWTTMEACHFLHALAIGVDAERVLEVATGYGKSTAYLAAAVRHRNGKVFTMDIKKRSWAKRSPEQLISEAHLNSNVSMSFGIDARVVLLRILTEQPGPWVDFAFLDASHTIELDAFVGLAMWTHLRPGGVFVLDDLDWTVNKHGTPYSTAILPREKHLRLIFQYLSRMPDVLESFEWGDSEIGWSYGVLQKKYGDSGSQIRPLASAIISKWSEAKIK